MFEAPQDIEKQWEETGGFGPWNAKDYREISPKEAAVKKCLKAYIGRDGKIYKMRFYESGFPRFEFRYSKTMKKCGKMEILTPEKSRVYVTKYDVNYPDEDPNLDLELEYSKDSDTVASKSKDKYRDSLFIYKKKPIPLMNAYRIMEEPEWDITNYFSVEKYLHEKGYQKVKIIHYEKDGTIESISKYVHNDDCYLVREETYQGSLLGDLFPLLRHTYYYDIKRCIAKKIYYCYWIDKSGGKISEDRFKFNSDGLLTEKREGSFEPGGKYLEKKRVKYIYNDAFLLVKKKTFLQGNLDNWKILAYNDKGKVILEQEFDKDGTETLHYEFTYYPSGRIKRIKRWYSYWHP